MHTHFRMGREGGREGVTASTGCYPFHSDLIKLSVVIMGGGVRVDVDHVIPE